MTTSVYKPNQLNLNMRFINYEGKKLLHPAEFFLSFGNLPKQQFSFETFKANFLSQISSGSWKLETAWVSLIINNYISQRGFSRFLVGKLIENDRRKIINLTFYEPPSKPSQIFVALNEMRDCDIVWNRESGSPLQKAVLSPQKTLWSKLNRIRRLVRIFFGMTKNIKN